MAIKQIKLQVMKLGDRMAAGSPCSGGRRAGILDVDNVILAIGQAVDPMF